MLSEGLGSGIPNKLPGAIFSKREKCGRWENLALASYELLAAILALRVMSGSRRYLRFVANYSQLGL